ncbi:MAG: hypothetical protein OEY89_06015 [Gammaproteobacteria bacterium]|nr:hypothetical protein [Gammaproteobacteria bacterium]
MSELEMDAESLTRVLGHVADYVIDVRRNAYSEVKPQNDESDQFDAELDQFITLMGLWVQGNSFPDNREPGAKSAVSLDKRNMADLGLRIAYSLSQWAKILYLDDVLEELEIVTFAFGLWCARNLGYIAVLDPIVDAVSGYANRQSDPHVMNAFSGLICELMDAVDNEIRVDKNNDDPNRPWRLLNFNYGIVATRSLDPQLMEQAFDQIWQRFPEDAAVFFKEGFEQMDVVDYPEYVRAVMEKYYHATNEPTVH